jgi:FtsH-binding integral membrane protein
LSKSSTPSAAASSTTPLLVGACIAWGVVTLLFFLLFSSPGEDGVQPDWFLAGINLLEMGAFFLASLLCFRNWRSSQIVSGRNVWLWIGLGLLVYAIGIALFFIWGTVWGLDPAVSLGDFFFITSYVFLATGMFKAVLPRRLNLELAQWLIVVGIGLAGILLAVFVNLAAGEVAADTGLPPAPRAVYLAQAQPGTDPADPTLEDVPTAPVVAPEPADTPEAPEAVLALDSALEPLADIVGLLYLIGDMVLLVIAGTLLVAFWGGRYSQSWKLIAIAALCLYVADMFFAYAINTDTYVEGNLWEVFWTFSAVFFGLGAVVEHAVSVNSRRSPRRRRG